VGVAPLQDQDKKAKEAEGGDEVEGEEELPMMDQTTKIDKAIIEEVGAVAGEATEVGIQGKSKTQAYQHKGDHSPQLSPEKRKKEKNMLRLRSASFAPVLWCIIPSRRVITGRAIYVRCA
jgi:hypothetical protein